MKTLLAIIFLSCSVLAQDEAAIAKTRTACGPDNVEFDAKITDAAHLPAAPDQGKALVYVIGQGISGKIIARIGVDGAWAGALRTTSYISFAVEPGEHHLCANWQSRFGSLNKYVALSGFTAEAGKAYYFRTRFFQGDDFHYYMDLDLINRDEGQYLVASSPVGQFHPKKPD